MVRKIGEARTEEKVWEIVNRERRNRKIINKEIKLKEWKHYFMGGMKERVIKGIGKKNRSIG